MTERAGVELDVTPARRTQGTSRRVFSVLVVGALARVCGAKERSVSVDVSDAADAEARFRAVQGATIAPRFSKSDRVRAEGLLARAPSSERSTCRDARTAIAASGVPETLHGSLQALDRAGECWVLRWDGQLGLGLGAVVARDGTVLLSWWIPDG